MESTLLLVSSGQVPRQCAVQIPLIGLLCDYGAEINRATSAALAHGEFEAAEELIRRGAKLDLPVAAAMGRLETARQLLPASDGEDRHRALALATQHGHFEIVRLLLDAGGDPNRYNPVGCHSHSSPLHQAALGGHDAVVRLLVERGARLDIRDIQYRGTPVDWAQYGGRTETDSYLRAEGGKSTTELGP